MKKFAFLLILTIAQSDVFGQMLVFDQGTWSLLANQTNIMQYWQQHNAQQLLNILQENQSIRVNVERIRESVERSEVIHGVPSNIRTTIQLESSLSPLMDLDSLEKKAEKDMKADKRNPTSNPAEYDLRVRDASNTEASEHIMEAYGVRGKLIATLTQLAKRLDNANTDAEVSKITAEVGLVNASLAALKAEEDAQLRFGELTDRKREIVKKRAALIKSRKEGEEHRKATDKEMKYKFEQLQAATGGGDPDPNNLYSRVLHPYDPLAATDWTAVPSAGSFPGFANSTGVVTSGLTVEQLIQLRISQIQANPVLTDAQKEVIIAKLKESLANAK